jgi:hypothetical protein
VYQSVPAHFPLKSESLVALVAFVAEIFVHCIHVSAHRADLNEIFATKSANVLFNIKVAEHVTSQSSRGAEVFVANFARI